MPPAARDAVRLQLLLHVLRLDDLVHLGVEALDDGRGRPFGPMRPCQLVDFVAGHAGFGDGRDARARRSTRSGVVTAIARTRFAFTCGKPGLRRREHELDLSRDEIGERRAAALVRHVRHLDARHVQEELGREMHDRALAAAAVGDLAGPRLRERDELARRARGQRRMHDDDERAARDEQDRREIVGRIELERIQARD